MITCQKMIGRVWVPRLRFMRLKVDGVWEQWKKCLKAGLRVAFITVTSIRNA